MNVNCWEAAGYALRGKMHAESDEPCQDKICYSEANGVTAIALSDGAGRAKLSHFGAARAVELACRKICRDFYKMLNHYDSIAVKKGFLGYLRDKLSLMARRLECRMEDISSTLLVAAADGKHYVTLHIGDGVIGAFTCGQVLTISDAYNGNAVTETDFITGRYALNSLKLFRGTLKRNGVSGFVLMSDGADRSYYDPVRRVLMPSLSTIRRECFALEESEREGFLRNELIDAARYSWTPDDCSIIMMSKA